MIRSQNWNNEVAAQHQDEEECVGENEGKTAAEHDDHGNKNGRQVGDVQQ